MFEAISALEDYTLIVIATTALLLWGAWWLRKEVSRRAEQALLASVVDHFILDRVRNDHKFFKQDLSRVARKAWRFTEWCTSEGIKKSPEPHFEALLDGATNKCFRVTFSSIPSTDKTAIGGRRSPSDNTKSESSNSPPNDAQIASWGINKMYQKLVNSRMLVSVGRGGWFGRKMMKSSSNSSVALSSASGASGSTDTSERMAFMRVQGAGSVLSNPREQEMAIFQYAARAGLGATLYAVFENGYVAEYVKGRVVKVDEMSEVNMVKKIATLVGRWHSMKVPSKVYPSGLIPKEWIDKAAERTKPIIKRVTKMANLESEKKSNGKDRNQALKGSASTMERNGKEDRGEEMGGGERKVRKTLEEISWASLSTNPAKKKMSLHANTFEMINKWLLRAKRLYNAEDARLLSEGREPTFAEFIRELELTKRDVMPYWNLPKTASAVLCHNDLNHGNLLYHPSTEALSALDLEFAGINHRGFDMGNHFCEYAGLELKYEKLPTNKQIKLWCFYYLVSLATHNADHFPGFCRCHDCLLLDETNIGAVLEMKEISSDFLALHLQYDQHHDPASLIHAPTSHEALHIPLSQAIQEMCVEARKYMQVSHLFWWLWAMIQIKISNIEGFNAVNYAHTRWAEYQKHKNATLALPHPPRLLSLLNASTDSSFSFSSSSSISDDNLADLTSSTSETSFASSSSSSSSLRRPRRSSRISQRSKGSSSNP